MRRSTERILVSHAGTTPKPTDAPDLASGVKQVVRKHAEVGIDTVNDGELSKSNFTNYVRDPLSGTEPAAQGAEPPQRNINARDLREFPEFFATGGGGFGRNRPGTPGIPVAFLQRMVVTGPITYVGDPTVRSDIDNMKAAVEGLDVEPFLP